MTVFRMFGPVFSMIVPGIRNFGLLWLKNGILQSDFFSWGHSVGDLLAYEESIKNECPVVPASLLDKVPVKWICQFLITVLETATRNMICLICYSDLQSRSMYLISHIFVSDVWMTQLWVLIFCLTVNMLKIFENGVGK